MLKIFTSNTGNNAAHLAMEELNRNNLPGSNHIVIVPDRFAMSVEKEIFEYLGLDGAFNIDVVSFTRLAIKHLCGAAKECLTKEGAVVLLSSIIIAEKDNLKFYGKLAKKRDLAKDLYAVIASLRSSRITPDIIRQVFADKPANVRDKYSDIAHLIELYEEKLSTIKGDTLTRLSRFREGIKDNDIIKNSDVYVIGFDSFKGNEYDIIDQLVKTAKSVNIALNIGEDGSKNSRLFSISEVKKLANLTGGEVIRSTRKLPLEIEQIYSNVFSMSGARVSHTDRVVLVEEPTTYNEIKGIALEISSLIRQGYRYQDIAVVIHDDSLKPIIEDIFTRLGIPLYVDKKYPLKETLVARLVDSAIGVLTSGLERDRVLAFAKNPILGISYQDIENLNDYILRHNLNYQHLSNVFSNGEDAVAIEATRRVIIDRLPKLPSNFIVSQGIQEIRNLYKEVSSSVYDGLYGEEGVSTNKIILDINKRAADLLDQELDEFSHLVGEQLVTLEDFYVMVKGGIESVEISLIPNVMDAVFVGTNSDSRFFDKKVIFIAGAVDGVMPVSPSYHAIMPERDIAMLEAKEVYVYPTPIETIRRDKGGLAELLTTATDRVYVSYAQFSVLGTKQNMGELFKQLKYILAENQVISLSQKYSANNAASLGNVNNAYYEYLRRRNKGMDQGSKDFINKLRGYLVSKGYGDRLLEKSASQDVQTTAGDYLTFRDGKYYVYPTQIEEFYKCPYRHFLRFGLRLTDKEKGDADAKVIGIFLHEVLEKFFILTKNTLRDMSVVEIKAVAEKVADDVANMTEYSYLNNDPKNQKLLRDVKRESIENILRMVPQIKVSSFTPTYFEYRFVNEGLSVKVGDAEILLKGTIDRVDLHDGKFFVVDYKSGKVTGKDKSDKLYYGTNLQLYLYLLPLIREGLTPVGAFYLSVSAGYEKDGDKISRFVGKVTTDEDVLRLMDSNLSLDGTKVVTTALPSALKVTKKGVEANGNAGFMREDFVFAANYARDMVASALEAMDQGYIAKRPVEPACNYCEYWPLCKDKKERKTSSKTIKNGAFVGEETNG